MPLVNEITLVSNDEVSTARRPRIVRGHHKLHSGAAVVRHTRQDCDPRIGVHYLPGTISRRSQSNGSSGPRGTAPTVARMQAKIARSELHLIQPGLALCSRG